MSNVIYMNPGKVNFLGYKGERDLDRVARFKVSNLSSENEEINIANFDLNMGWSIIIEQDGQLTISYDFLREGEDYLDWRLVWEKEKEENIEVSQEEKEETSPIIYCSPLAIEGIGRCQVIHKYNNETGKEIIEKSDIYYFSVGEALPDLDGSLEPPNLESWLDKITSNEVIERLNGLISQLNPEFLTEALAIIREAENKGRYIIRITPAVEKAEPLINNINTYAKRSKAWAIGKMGEGNDEVDVPSTDDAYNNHSKYYANHAKAWAVGTNLDGIPIEVPEDNNINIPHKENSAFYYKSLTESFKNKAEGFKNETEDFKNEALNYKNDAEAWAVGEVNSEVVPKDHFAYENNAKYYAAEAKNSLDQMIKYRIYVWGEND